MQVLKARLFLLMLSQVDPMNSPAQTLTTTITGWVDPPLLNTI